MKTDRLTRALLAIIALALCILAFRPYFATAAVSAQVNGAKPGDLWVS